MRILLALAALLALVPPAHAQPGRSGLVVPVAGVPLDPVDLIRAENPAQAFSVTLETENGATLVPEGNSIRFRVTSTRAGYLTLVSQDEAGRVTVLYPNRYASGERLAAGATVEVPAGNEFRFVARAPFGREVMKALVTPAPLLDMERAAAAWRRSAVLRVEGPPPTDAGNGLGGLDPATWGTASLAFETVPTRATGAPPVLPPPPESAYRPEAPLDAWLDRYQGLRGAPSVVKTWGLFTPPAAPAQSEPEAAQHDSTLVVVYRPTTGWRSFGRPSGGGGVFGQVRYVDPAEDAPDASGTRSLRRTFGGTFDEVLAGLDADPDVLAAVPNYRVQSLGFRSAVPLPTLPAAGDPGTPTYWEAQWGLHNPFFRSPAERLDVAWRAAMEQYRGPDGPVVVAVLDTGVRFDNPHLGPVLWRNELEIAENGIDDDGNGFVDDVRGWDALDGDGDPTDPNAEESHGTFVASQIGGVGAAIQSMAPDVRILPVRVLDAEGGGSLRQLIEGVRYAARNGARVVNLSFGIPPMDEANPALERLLAALYAEAADLGVVMVMAAGNHAADGRTVHVYPSGVRGENTISAAALTMTGELAPFSNYGPAVDVAAPGQAIVSHAGRGVTVDAFDGTSMAAPFVSALAAMLIAQNPTWTPAEVRAAIVETVRPIPSLDVASGGLIDAAAALARARQ